MNSLFPILPDRTQVIEQRNVILLFRESYQPLAFVFSQLLTFFAPLLALAFPLYSEIEWLDSNAMYYPEKRGDSAGRLDSTEDVSTDQSLNRNDRMYS